MSGANMQQRRQQQAAAGGQLPAAAVGSKRLLVSLPPLSSHMLWLAHCHDCRLLIVSDATSWIHSV